MGELGLTIEQFKKYTISQIDSLIEGANRRRTYIEDLFICYSALPVYRTLGGDNAPTYEELTSYRRADEKTETEFDFWRRLLKEKERKNVEKRRN